MTLQICNSELYQVYSFYTVSFNNVLKLFKNSESGLISYVTILFALMEFHTESQWASNMLIIKNAQC